MSNNIRLRLLSYIVIAYMLLAFGWWSVLLFTKNKDAFDAKAELLWLGMYTEDKVKDKATFLATPEYEELDKKYRRQEYMIFGEAAVFVLSLVIGIWLINRSYHEEMIAEQQRRNFLLSITHELKSPIASISLVLETFIKRNLNKTQIDKLGQNALKETKRLNSLVNNLLLAAKVESAYEPVMEDIDLTQIILDIIKHFQEQYPNAKFNFTTENTPEIIKGDSMGWTSIVINLIENAIKYSPEKIDVTITLKKEKNKHLLEIADKGIGIADKEKRKIFDRFYRVGNEDTRKTKGTGLGLYIVSQITKAHKGKIQARDNTPHGTVFCIELPRIK